jgi:hypothetical protein
LADGTGSQAVDAAATPIATTAATTNRLRFTGDGRSQAMGHGSDPAAPRSTRTTIDADRPMGGGSPRGGPATGRMVTRRRSPYREGMTIAVRPTAKPTTAWSVVAAPLSPRTWAATTHVLLDLLVGTIVFTFAVTALSVTFSLLVTIVFAIPAFAVLLLGLRFIGAVERARFASLLGVAIPDPYPVFEGGAWSRIRAWVFDPAPWKELLYSLLLFPGVHRAHARDGGVERIARSRPDAGLPALAPGPHRALAVRRVIRPVAVVRRRRGCAGLFIAPWVARAGPSWTSSSAPTCWAAARPRCWSTGSSRSR